jgi:hypothetical protein
MVDAKRRVPDPRPPTLHAPILNVALENLDKFDSDNVVDAIGSMWNSELNGLALAMLGAISTDTSFYQSSQSARTLSRMVIASRIFRGDFGTASKQFIEIARSISLSASRCCPVLQMS